MSKLDQARATQLRNIETKTGKTLAELCALIERSGLARHGELRQMLMDTLGLGYGDANTLVHVARNAEGAVAPAGSPAAAPPADAALAAIYSGNKAALRPLHDVLMAQIAALGAFEVAPKKSYLSLRRKKQFAMVGPATKDRIEIGLNVKDLAGTARLLAQPPGGMCLYKVRIATPDEVDTELLGWLRRAYDSAG